MDNFHTNHCILSTRATNFSVAIDQCARIHRAWFPSVIFPKYGSVVEREELIVNRLRRATKRDKFSRTAWEFDVVLNSRQ